MTSASPTAPGHERLTAGTAGPSLPAPRGLLSRTLLDALSGSPGPIEIPGPTGGDPLSDDDLHLALYVCYEIHYRGFAGVDPSWEWEPGLIAFRRGLEGRFEAALCSRCLDVAAHDPHQVPQLLKALSPGTEESPLADFLAHDATLEQFKEFVMHRSAYQLKEADPHSWIIARLDGAAKAALVEIQADEYGGGRPERMHSRLFRNSMEMLGLDGSYGAYLDLIPGVTLATVNLISLFALHRRCRGAAVGHLAHFEMTSPVPNRGYGDGLRRLGIPQAAAFFDEHVEADSVHEAIAAHDMAGGLARQEPWLVSDILYGARACALLDAAFGEHLLGSWSAGLCSLRREGSSATLR